MELSVIKIQQVNLSEGLLFTIYAPGRGSTEFYRGDYTDGYSRDISIRDSDERLLFQYEGEIQCEKN